MVHAFFAAAVMGAFACWRLRARIVREGRGASVGCKLLGHSLEFLATLAAVLLLYHLLLVAIAAGWPHVSPQALLKLEQRLDLARASVERFKPGWLTTLAILLAIYLLGAARVWVFRTDGPLRAFKKAKAAVRMAGTALLLLCSFTLLGAELGEPAATLAIRVRTTQEAHGALRREVEQALLGSVADRLDERVATAWGPAFRALPRVAGQAAASAGALQRDLTTARQEQRVTRPDAERALKRHAQVPRAGAGALALAARGASAEAVVAPEMSEPWAPYRVVEKARNAVAKAVQGRAGRELAGHLTGGSLQSLLGAIVRPVAEAHPLLKPALDVISSTLGDDLRARVDRELDSLTRSVVEAPEQAQALLSGAATRVGAAVEEAIPPEVVHESEGAVKQLEEDLHGLELARAQLAETVRAAREAALARVLKTRREALNRTIAQLRSPKKELRERAAAELSNAGETLDAHQVERVVELMRHGRDRWLTSTEREEGHHCTWYEHTSVRHYAALALTTMKSAYVTPAVLRESRDAMRDGVTREKVTDPGWI